MADRTASRTTVVSDDALIRTHLANERTFLAWLRTAIVLIGAGVAAAALTETEGDERSVAVGIGTLSVLAGCGLLVFAYFDFRGTQIDISRRRHRPSRGMPLLATVLVAAVGVAALVFAIVEWGANL